MKPSRVVALVAVGVVGIAGAWPAQAAGPYTIAAGAANVAATRQAFAGASCNEAVANSPANGTDARIIDVSSMAGSTRTITWSSTVPFVQGVSQLAIHFYSGSCSYLYEGAFPDPTVHTQSRTFRVPSGTRWMVVEAFRTANVTFHVN